MMVVSQVEGQIPERLLISISVQFCVNLAVQR